jgi:hypothetical protein
MCGAAVPRSFTGVSTTEVWTTNCWPSPEPELGMPSALSEPWQLVHGTSAVAVLPFTVSECTPKSSDTLGTEELPAGRSTVILSVAGPQPAEDTRVSPL